MQEHEKFLKNFTNLFKQIDQDRVGFLNEQQFRMLIAGMELRLEEEQINFLLQEIDPYNNNKMTYSEIVQLLSSQMVPSSDDPNDPSGQIPILEKFSLITEQNLGDPLQSKTFANEYGNGSDTMSG